MLMMVFFAEQFLDILPPFVFMTALPQLLSRLGHPNGKVFAILKTILATLIKAFPQQCLWAVQTVAKVVVVVFSESIIGIYIYVYVLILLVFCGKACEAV